MKTTARQFFDIWAECVMALGFAIKYPDSSNEHKRIAVRAIHKSHGRQIAIEAECYFERLRADTQAGISSL